LENYADAGGRRSKNLGKMPEEKRVNDAPRC
jgi:hypothetical protein